LLKNRHFWGKSDRNFGEKSFSKNIEIFGKTDPKFEKKSKFWEKTIEILENISSGAYGKLF